MHNTLSSPHCRDYTLQKSNLDQGRIHPTAYHLLLKYKASPNCLPDQYDSVSGLHKKLQGTPIQHPQRQGTLYGKLSSTYRMDKHDSVNDLPTESNTMIVTHSLPCIYAYIRHIPVSMKIHRIPRHLLVRHSLTSTSVRFHNDYFGFCFLCINSVFVPAYFHSHIHLVLK